jgi:hypothetical protein
VVGAVLFPTTPPHRPAPVRPAYAVT